MPLFPQSALSMNTFNGHMLPNRYVPGRQNPQQNTQPEPEPAPPPINRGTPEGLLGGSLGQPANMMDILPWQQRQPGLLGPMSFNQQGMNLSQNNPVDPYWYYKQMLALMPQQYRNYM